MSDNTNDLMKPVVVTTYTSDGVAQEFVMDRIKAELLKVEGAIVDFLPDEVQGGIVPIMKKNGAGEELISDKGNLGKSLIALITGRKKMCMYASNNMFDLRQSNLITRKQKHTYKPWQSHSTS